LGCARDPKEPASNYRELDRAQTRDVQPTRELSANRAALGARAHRARRRDRVSREQRKAAFAILNQLERLEPNERVTVSLGAADIGGKRYPRL